MTATGTLTITDFLLARIGEEEVDAAIALVREDMVTMESSGYPARVLAECKAKREIVDECERSMLNDKDSSTAEWIAAHLAAVHASHPDYNPTWAPES